MFRTRRVFAVLLASFVVILSAVLFACSQTPTSVPIRTFERAQRVDVLCLKVFGDNAPAPRKQEECAPVPPEISGVGLENHLFALVTQTTRGEIAVVDLSAGSIVDQHHAIPGLNFLPVGANPTDIATTPDGRMAFVSAAEPNKFAIYGIPGRSILGVGDPRGEQQNTLASWPVCALPQRPGSLTVVPRRAGPGVVTDAGTGAGVVIDYELVAVLPGDRSHSTKVVTIDPKPFLRENAAEDFGQGDKLDPGVMQACPITAAIELSGEDAVPATFRSGGMWPDGVSWVDGGADLTCERPSTFSSCGLRPCKCAPLSVPPDGGTDAGEVDAGETACEPDAGQPDSAERVLDLGPLDPPQAVAIARDDQTLYVADQGVPLIHVIDLSTPGAPRELPPFVATSVLDPTRAVTIRDLAVSPPTHDFKRFLYAVDREEGSIVVFDVTDPVNAERTPMLRPHPELNPFQPPDRIGFISPVVTVSFARHDVPVLRLNGNAVPNPPTGVLCNPNPNLDPLAMNGSQYRANSQGVNYALGSRRLRGVFAFATLSNGQIVAIDVDDWDAPCRRPVDLSDSRDLPVARPVPLPSIPAPGVLALSQPAAVAGDFDPYHVPSANPLWVSQESFFPVSAPHRMRANDFLIPDGNRIPFLSAVPTITSTGATQPPLVGPGHESTPRLRPTLSPAELSRKATKQDDKTQAEKDAEQAARELIGIKLSFDTPEVHVDQDWTVTYEGKLPGFDGLPGTLDTTDGYDTLVLSQAQARFCAKGVEDWSVGQERAAAIVAELAKQRREYPEPLGQRMVDYIQVVDELLPDGDPYWAQGGECSDFLGSTPSARYALCANHFASAGEQSPNRDFPILEAYDDHIVLGSFSSVAPGTSSTRTVVTGPANKAFLKALQCCFHHQTKFAVRTGAQWVTSTAGAVPLTFSHMTPGAGGRCVPSCETNLSLLNSRAPALPYSPGDFAPVRDSPLAMRNPMFSFFVQNGYACADGSQSCVDEEHQADRIDRRPDRDMTYRFSTRGGFIPLLINLASQTAAVTPQSMRYIESLGQIAVVDGASQGLVLIDLAGVGIARAPYF